MVIDDNQWHAIEERDGTAAFLYGVTTTTVYCRPACPSRRPRRENATIFDSPGAAAAAGFRPCKRCRPDQPATAPRHADLVAQVCRIIESGHEPPALADLAASVGLSAFHFHRVFKEITGLTPKAYAEATRNQRAREGLENADKVTGTIYDAGFGSSGHFYATASDRLGMTPSRYRDGGRDETIRFAVGESSLGPMLVAATDKGVCAIHFGDSSERLVRDLQDRFPHAELIGGDPRFETLVASVVAVVEGSGPPAELPLDIRGTAFQQRVWLALLAVPPGTTVTYQDLARRIGSPRSARAVAAACAANTIAVAIPCHRVVRTDGSLSGYRWGIDRKATLLRHEGAIRSG